MASASPEAFAAAGSCRILFTLFISVVLDCSAIPYRRRCADKRWGAVASYPGLMQHIIRSILISILAAFSLVCCTAKVYFLSTISCGRSTHPGIRACWTSFVILSAP